MIGMDDSKSNRNIVEMIKKIALAIESKNTKELREIAEELETWQPRGKWDEMDVRTKVFVEHVLVGLARIQLGMDVLDQGAHELGEIREKLEETLDELDKGDKYAGAPYEQDEDEEDIRRTFDIQDVERRIARCARCLKVTDRKSQAFKDYGICKSCFDSVPNIDEIYNDETIQSKGLADYIEGEDLPRERHIDGKGNEQCHRCGSFNDFKKMKLVHGYSVCPRCFRGFMYWFEKAKKGQEKSEARVGEELFPKGMSWDEKERRRTELAKWFEKLKRDFNDGKGWIDWKKYHESRKKDARDKRLKDKRGSKKGRYRKDEISDDTKEELK
tara:strand:+ start:2950 stop:3936 length:987 start_codon:yes stop_codon:yes gene_type:complete